MAARDANEKTRAVVQILAGRSTVEDVAKAHGASEQEVLAWKELYLNGAESALSSRDKPRRQQGWIVGSAVAMVAALGWIGHARSQDAACPQLLPAPLVTLCANTPARASEVNGNFQQIVDWIEDKVGAVTAGGVTASSVQATTSVTTPTANVTNVNAVRVSSQAYVPQAADWSSQGVGAGGAAVYNDTNAFKTLMLVGNDSGGGGARRVGLWDDVTVARNLRVNGQVSIGGALYADGGLGARGCYWQQGNPNGWNDNTYHTAECPGGYYMAGWQCYATDRIDGQCSIKCCKP